MKRLKSAILIGSLILGQLLVAGCFASPQSQIPTTTAMVSTTVTTTTVATTHPVASATPSIKPTVTPTLKPTPKPTMTPSAGSDKIVLAEGFYSIKLDAALKKRITGLSYPADDTNCQISYDDLRYVRLLHYDFEGKVLQGELIVNKKLASEIMEIFYALYKAKYPFASVKLVDEYGEAANDDLSMEANNTSAFNYRYVTGTKTLSRHSYGAAIDINPLFNPYIVGDRIAPVNAAPYADRTKDFPGKIDHNDLCYQLFIKHGWRWGGDWTGDKDYQHFSKKLN